MWPWAVISSLRLTCGRKRPDARISAIHYSTHVLKSYPCKESTAPPWSWCELSKSQTRLTSFNPRVCTASCGEPGQEVDTAYLAFHKSFIKIFQDVFVEKSEGWGLMEVEWTGLELGWKMDYRSGNEGINTNLEDRDWQNLTGSALCLVLFNFSVSVLDEEWGHMIIKFEDDMIVQICWVTESEFEVIWTA